MSFALDLLVDDLDRETAERAVEVTRGADILPVVQTAGFRFWRRSRPRLRFDWREGQEVLSDQADWDEDEFTLDPPAAEKLARSVSALARVLKPGWGIRAYWEGDPVDEELRVSAEALEERVRASALRRNTLYRVG